MEDEACSPVFAEIPDLVILEHTECLGGIVVALHVRRVENVAKFVPGEAIEHGIVCVQLGTEKSPPPLIPGEGRA